MARGPRNASIIGTGWTDGATSISANNIGTDEPSADENNELGNGDGGTQVLNPATLGESTATDQPEQPKRKRGPKPGSKRGAKSASTKETQDLAEMIRDGLGSVHAGLLLLTRSELWQISDEETKRIADRAAAVAEFYVDVRVPTKYGAWFNLTVALGSVYGSRIVAARVLGAPTQSQQRQHFQGFAS